NFWADRGLTYMKLFLMDSPNEDVTCVMYDVFAYLDSVRRAGKKVFVHCQQGVSRSTIMCIAYLMFHNNKDYQEMYEYVRERRGICRCVSCACFACSVAAFECRP